MGAGPLPSAASTTPIQHIVVLMQENHTFDNYFGTYPGADGIPAGTCMPRDPANPAAGCVAPYHLPSRRTVDLSHGTDVAAIALNGGKLDGFIAAQNQRNLPGETAMGYYDGSDLPFYWNLASSSVLADRFFSSDAGGSKENHLYWVAGQSGGGSVPAKGYQFATIFDRLQAAGIDWKFYVQNYDPSITYRNLTGAPQDSQTIWVPLLNFDRFLDDPALAKRIVDVSQYHEDLAAGTLPAVAFIAPSGASEHPPGDVAIGQVYGASQVTALMQSSSWSSSLFVLTWDDWGGWYDHVLPPTIDANGFGMRVPALFVSPYAPPGRIDSTTYDFTSILRFIEDNWQLQPMTARDAAANSVGTALDFRGEPRPPILPGPVYPDDAVVNPRARLALLAIYGIIGVGLPVGVAVWWRRRTWAGDQSTEFAVPPIEVVPVGSPRVALPAHPIAAGIPSERLGFEGVAVRPPTAEEALAARLATFVVASTAPTQPSKPLLTKLKVDPPNMSRAAPAPAEPATVTPARPKTRAKATAGKATAGKTPSRQPKAISTEPTVVARKARAAPAPAEPAIVSPARPKTTSKATIGKARRRASNPPITEPRVIAPKASRAAPAPAQPATAIPVRPKTPAGKATAAKAPSQAASKPPITEPRVIAPRTSRAAPPPARPATAIPARSKTTPKATVGKAIPAKATAGKAPPQQPKPPITEPRGIAPKASRAAPAPAQPAPASPARPKTTPKTTPTATAAKAPSQPTAVVPTKPPSRSARATQKPVVEPNAAARRSRTAGDGATKTARAKLEDKG